MASPYCTHVKAPKALSIFTASMSGILSLITICGNVAICLAVYIDPYGKLRTPFMYLLVNLAVSDLIVGCVAMPISIATHTMEAVGTKKRVHVHTILVAYFISSTASLLSFAALCIDRYFAVMRPFVYRRNAKPLRCVLTIVTIWLISLSLPMLYFVTGYATYLMIFAHTSVISCVVILIFTYFKIFRILKAQSSRVATGGLSRQLSNQNQQVKITKVFITTLCAYAALYVPVIVMIYILKFCPRCDCIFRHALRDMQYLLAVSSSTWNPFVYTLQLQPFRMAMSKILKIHGREEARPNRSVCMLPPSGSTLESTVDLGLQIKRSPGALLETTGSQILKGSNYTENSSEDHGLQIQRNQSSPEASPNNIKVEIQQSPSSPESPLEDSQLRILESPSSPESSLEKSD